MFKSQIFPVFLFFPQAFFAGDAEDVERRGPEPPDRLLPGAAGPHLLRAGQPQGKAQTPPSPWEHGIGIPRKNSQKNPKVNRVMGGKNGIFKMFF